MRIARACASLALLTLLAPGPASAADPFVPIQPGARLNLLPGTCTANFVFAQGADRYIGTAGHCAGLGRIIGDEQGEPIGNVVYSVNAYPALDFALIKIYAHRLDDVSPAMRVWGGPTGIAKTGPLTGDTTLPGALIRQHGYGTTWRELEQTQRRTGVLGSVPTHIWSGWLPCSGGDSGSGVILASGEALGVLDVALLAPGGLDPTLMSLIGKISPECGGSTITHVLYRLRIGGFPDISLVTAPLAPLI
jgi:hypothetical protein